MFPPFPQETARHYCQEFISDIEDGFVCLKQISQISQERQNHGIMAGCLVCTNQNNERVILHAISGISIDAYYKKNYDTGSGLLSYDTGSGLLSGFSAESENCYTTIKNGIKHIIVGPIVQETDIQQALAENDLEIHQLTQEINKKPDNLEELKKKRSMLTDQSLQKVFNLYNFTRFDGKKVTLSQIIKARHGKLPPTGTGDCCAPKLLSYAFENNLQPLSMDEIFYGKNTKNKENGKSYPPCDERCGYILPSILGVEILYRDKTIVVVNKESGLLSVPGRTEDKQDCVVNRIKTLFPDCITQPAVHRLDMETSGILILAFSEEAHKKLSLQFENGLVQKKYIALLDGLLPNNEIKGQFELKFRLDVENRPHQIYDEENGKIGITQWEKKGTVLYKNPGTNEKRRTTKILFTPLTGRTHQLRLAASDKHGFGIPIIGDSLYGKCEKGERLMLHAREIIFYHPVSGEKMHFICPEQFD